MGYQQLSDRNFLKCGNCGKYKVDTDEDFEVLYKQNGTKVWLCATCNRFRQVFKEETSELQLIIAPCRSEDSCIIYNREMYV